HDAGARDGHGARAIGPLHDGRLPERERPARHLLAAGIEALRHQAVALEGDEPPWFGEDRRSPGMHHSLAIARAEPAHVDRVPALAWRERDEGESLTIREETRVSERCLAARRS